MTAFYRADAIFAMGAANCAGALRLEFIETAL
jgi:hypothetical protein